MRYTKTFTVAIAIALMLALTACSTDAPKQADYSALPTAAITPAPSATASPAPTTAEPAAAPTALPSVSPTVLPKKQEGFAYLYGEAHGYEKIMDEELRLWQEYYENENMRHLFVELSYYSAELLNLWMQADDDKILDELYSDWQGTFLHSPLVKQFYMDIKETCPETIFHGTDVGHQYETTGQRYLQLLEKEGKKDTEQYSLALKAINQGRKYQKDMDEVYRENTMTANFIREFEAVGSENIMGIYGAAHTRPGAKDYMTQTVPNMASQLQEEYGDLIFSTDLSMLAKNTEPERMDKILVGEKEYEAAYFGEQKMDWHKTYDLRHIWRLEDAYDDFSGNPKNGNYLPAKEYPMAAWQGQVFVIDYMTGDVCASREYHRCDGQTVDGDLVTEEFILESDK